MYLVAIAFETCARKYFDIWFIQRSLIKLAIFEMWTLHIFEYSVKIAAGETTLDEPFE